MDSSPIPVDSSLIPLDSGPFQQIPVIPAGICGAVRSTGSTHKIWIVIKFYIFTAIGKRLALPNSERYESKQINLNPKLGFYHLPCQKVVEDIAEHSKNFYIDLARVLSFKSCLELHQSMVVIF